MRCRKLLIVLTIFHAAVNTFYLARFFGVLPPEEVVCGYVPWFMSFALPNIVFTLLSWFLVYLLFKKLDTLMVVTGLLIAGGLIFHALNGFMFGFFSGSLQAMTAFNAVYEIAVYVYGLALAAFYITQFRKIIAKDGVK